MKKVLIFAYDFPPYGSVGGLRPHYWYEHFKEMGVYPIVVTRNWNPIHNNELDYIQPSITKDVVIEETDKGTLIKVPYKATLSNRLNLKGKNDKFSNLLKKMSTGWNEIGQWYFPVGTKYMLYKVARAYLKNNKVDAILVTGEPFVLFRYASALSKEFNIVWHADYRDDWIDNHSREHNKSFFHKLLKCYYHSIEKRSLKNVSGISTVSDYLLEQIKKRTGIKRGLTIENGADLDLYTPKLNPYLQDDYVILYSGRLYNLSYLDNFEIGFERFINAQKNSDNVKAYFIGTEISSNIATDSLKKLKNKFPNNIILENSKSTSEIAQYQLHAHILLNLIAGDPEKGLIGAKSYNYAVTRNPILTIPYIKNKNSVFFPERDIQFIALSAQDVFEFLSSNFYYFCQNKKWKSSLTDKEQYQLSRKYNTEKLLSFILNSINGNS